MAIQTLGFIKMKIEKIVKSIHELALQIGIHFETSYNNKWAGFVEHTIGIPPKKPSKRKIWRGFFFIRPQIGTLCFYAPATPRAQELSQRYGLNVKTQHWDTVSGNSSLPGDIVFLGVSLGQIDFGDQKQRKFFEYIMRARHRYCFPKMKL